MRFVRAYVLPIFHLFFRCLHNKLYPSASTAVREIF